MKTIFIVLGALMVCTSTLMALPLSGGFTGGEMVSLTAPLPEPMTLTLLALGGAFAVRSRRW
jgi:hypothetical protein